MTIYVVLGEMGAGKTLLATALAATHYKRYNRIIANYFLRLPNAFYSAVPLPRIDERRVLLIYDDVYAYAKALQKFITFAVVNLSRKNDIDIIITAQRFNIVDKTIRQLAWIVKPRVVSNILIYRVGREYRYRFRTKYIRYIRNVRRFYKYYDTAQVVEPADAEILVCVLSELDERSREFYKHIISQITSMKRVLSELEKRDTHTHTL